MHLLSVPAITPPIKFHINLSAFVLRPSTRPSAAGQLLPAQQTHRRHQNFVERESH
jgi:hypothetical protein